GANGDGHGHRPGGRVRPAAAAERLADLRPVQQRVAGRLPDRLPVQRVPVHRAVLPVPEGPARLAVGQPDLGRRALVVRPDVGPARLLAGPVLVRCTTAPRAHGSNPWAFFNSATALYAGRRASHNRRMSTPASVLGPGGTFSDQFPGFESRP